MPTATGCARKPEGILNLPQNRVTRDESQFLNELIERKAFSWTRVLENLEKVMPPRVHLMSISPQLDDDNQLGLKMTVAGDSRDRALELARRMEDSRRFSQTRVEAGHSEQSATGDTERFDIVALYIPEPPTGEAAGEKRTESRDQAENGFDAKGFEAEDGSTEKTSGTEDRGTQREQALMPDLRRTRKSLKTALAIMAGMDVLAAVVYFSPLVGSAESRGQELNSLQIELVTKTRQVAPLKDLPEKVKLASHQIDDFYKKRFPSQQSQILTRIRQTLCRQRGDDRSGEIQNSSDRGRRVATGGDRSGLCGQLYLFGASSSTLWNGTRCSLSSTA